MNIFTNDDSIFIFFKYDFCFPFFYNDTTHYDVIDT